MKVIETGAFGGKQGFGDVILVARRLAPLIEAEQLSKRKEIGTALQRRKAPCYDYIQLANPQFVDFIEIPPTSATNKKCRP